MNIGRWPKLLAITTSSLGSAIFPSRTGRASSCLYSNAAFAQLQSGPQHLRVHTVRGQAPTKQRLDIVDHDIRHQLTYLDGCAAEMRREHDVLQLLQLCMHLRLMLEYVEPRAGDLL